MKKLITLGCLLLCSSTCLLANVADDRFQQANNAYQKNDFANAAQLYQQVLAEGFNSPELQYNLGNTYYKQDSLGKAILHYERALVLAPNDADTKANLAIAKAQVKGELEPLPEFFLTAAWKKLRNTISSSYWGIVALAFWWLGFGALAVWLMGKSRKQKKTGFLAGTACLLLSLLPYSLALSSSMYEQNTRQAILLKDAAPLRSAPDKDGSELLTLYEGTKVQLLDFLGGWWQVKLPNGERGWLDGKYLEKI
ncbi:MAG: SH3 domain-containing protein [Lewinellaceae bacterium]|nr:SH3 domain-containing protein [Saprospiraceae bacterium]MCB9336768.1 SH3 domain-containing protein [Lewinellaceae bacterium]